MQSKSPFALCSFLFLGLGAPVYSQSSTYYWKHFSTSGAISPWYQNDNSWGVTANEGTGFVVMVTGEDWGTWVQVSPYPLIVETSCGKQRTGCDQRRLYPERKKLAPPDPDIIHYLAAQALTILQPDLDKRGEASNLFPPHLSPAHIRSAVARYEEDIKTAGKRAVGSCCGRLLHITVIHELDQDVRLRLLRSKLDLCGQHEHT